MTDRVSHETGCYTRNIAVQIEQKRTGRRKAVRHNGTLCSKCFEEPPMSGQRYGRRCHAAYERARRKSDREELAGLRAQNQKTPKAQDDGA